MQEQVNLAIVGDLCLDGSVNVSLSSQSISNSDLDLLLANLETPVFYGDIAPRSKAGPSLKGNLSNLSSVSKSIDRLCFTLANNHIMDYGEIGLQQTVESCHQLGISTVGGGMNLEEGFLPKILELQELRVGILGCCETQFGIASSWQAGVAPVNFKIYEAIRKLKTEVDVVVVSIHGGAEMCPWPSPKWQDLLRSFIDAGVNIIHGHHAHIPQGYESYNGGLIFYGLGNFLIDPVRCKGQPNTLWSVVGSCNLASDRVDYSVNTVVIEKLNDLISVRLSTEAEFQNHSTYLSKCNIPLQDRVLLTGLWHETAIRLYKLRYSKYLGIYSKKPKNHIEIKERLKKIKKLLASIFKDRSKQELLIPYHLFACETHCDAIATALGVLSGEIEDMRTAETCKLANEMMPWSTQSF